MIRWEALKIYRYQRPRQSLIEHAQVEEERMRTYRFLGKVNSEISIRRNLVLVVDSSETLDLSSSGLGVNTSSVSLLAVFERGGDVNEEEVSSSSSTVLNDVRFGEFSGSVVRSDRSSDNGSSGTRELSCESVFESASRRTDQRKQKRLRLTSYESETLQVLVTFLGSEAEFYRGDSKSAQRADKRSDRENGELTSRKLRSDDITEEEGARSTSLLLELRFESLGDSVGTRVDVTGEEDGETLLLFGGVRFTKDLDDGLVREPIGNGLNRRVSKSVRNTFEGSIERRGNSQHQS